MGALEPHRVVYREGHELACACGAVISNYGLTKTPLVLWAEHVRRENDEAQQPDLERDALLVRLWQDLGYISCPTMGYTGGDPAEFARDHASEQMARMALGICIQRAKAAKAALEAAYDPWEASERLAKAERDPAPAPSAGPTEGERP